MKRRSLLSFALALPVAVWALEAQAGSYLSRAAVLLRGAELEGKSLSRRFHDKELARVLHKIALERGKAANEMLVPEEVKRAHPHLLLVLESYERACEAATRGHHTDFLVSLSRAREEARIFEAVLKQAGWTLPG